MTFTHIHRISAASLFLAAVAVVVPIDAACAQSTQVQSSEPSIGGAPTMSMQPVQESASLNVSNQAAMWNTQSSKLNDPQVGSKEISSPGLNGGAPPLTNVYGLNAIWNQGDVVSRLTLGLLFLMSGLSWYIIISKYIEQRQFKKQLALAKQSFSESTSLRKRAANLDPKSVFKYLADRSFAAKRRHKKLSTQVGMSEWLQQEIVHSVNALQMQLQSGLPLLATVGSISPFVGLFGTVWGIYNALITIGLSGQASIEKVAGPVGESLVMTALGLAVAVPAVLGYNWLVRQNRLNTYVIKSFGSELHTLFLIEGDLPDDDGLAPEADSVTS